MCTLPQEQKARAAKLDCCRDEVEVECDAMRCDALGGNATVKRVTLRVQRVGPAVSGLFGGVPTVTLRLSTCTVLRRRESTSHTTRQ